jgi:DeoR family glycerol-3-phosphate regulon repressor
MKGHKKYATPSLKGLGQEEEASNSRAETIAERHKRIVEMVSSHGFVTIDDLAQRFMLTPQTIRRDINVLSEQGLLQRHHGGAGINSSVQNMAYTTRQVFCLEEKKRIAGLTAKYIPDYASMFINIGTTTEEVAKALLKHKGLKVITNNLNVAFILSANPDFEVIVTGGIVRSRDRGITGEATIDFINQFKVDYGIIGISGIDEDGSLLDFDYREVRAARAIIDNSRQVYLVTDYTKFGRNAMVRLGHIAEIDGLFTDQAPSTQMQKLIEESEVCMYHP